MTIDILYQNQYKTIRLSELPTFSAATAAHLKTTDAVKQHATLNGYDYTLTSTLKGRTQSVETVSTALSEMQEHKTREVIYACLKTALACAVIAGTVLIAVFGGEVALFAILIGIVGSFISSAIELNCFLKIRQFDRTDYWNVQPLNSPAFINPLAFFYAPFMPLYEVFTRKGRIERVQNKQNTEMEKDLRPFFEFADELSKNLKTVREQLQAIQAEKKALLEELKPGLKISARRPTIEVAIIHLEKDLTALENAQNDLTTLQRFLSCLK